MSIKVSYCSGNIHEMTLIREIGFQSAMECSNDCEVICVGC